jgi:hypothetical protein
VWHASISIWAKDGKRKRNLPLIAERWGIALLKDVGGFREWWIWRDDPNVLVGHLRVDVTDYEAQLIPPGCATVDAGDTGPERKRSL